MKLTHVLSIIPFIGVLGGIFFANRVTPYVLGLPFMFFWILLWLILTSMIMAIVFKIDPVNKEGAE
ncbi:DUF3311 domain-containing protein [Fictibacillus sp. Mic-4]|uniref:DUF3311 domain-containing protein n=1 Tax=Fictibacillus TaxID=1329200 RepID=UPI0004235849|nr:DUF3311 domain-containing protein [Fictibacillus gelatini]